MEKTNDLKFITRDGDKVLRQATKDNEWIDVPHEGEDNTQNAHVIQELKHLCLYSDRFSWKETAEEFVVSILESGHWRTIRTIKRYPL